MHFALSRFALLAALSLLSTEHVEAQISIGCPAGFSPPQTVTANTRYCYKHVNFGTGVSWASARQACRDAGGTLAAFRNAEEAAEVVTKFCGGLGAANQAIWLGLYVPSAYPGTYSACKVTALGKNNPCYNRANWRWENDADPTFYLANNANYWMGTDSYGWREPDDFGCAALNGGDERQTNLMGDLACDYDSTYPQYYKSQYACCEALILPTTSTTPSPSVSRSSSVTRSITPSVTVSTTVSPSRSVTPTVTPSVTRTRTSSRSVSVTSSVSATKTTTRSVTMTRSVTSSSSVSPSTSPSESATTSPSSSPSSSSSVSPSASESSSVSPSASESTSATASVTPSASVSTSVSPSVSESASPSESPLPPALVGIGNLNGISGADVNGTGLIVPEESTNGIVVIAGAGAGAVIGIIAALCCLWFLLLLPARRRKAEAEARRKKLSRPSAFVKSARNLGGKGKASGGLAGALELPGSAKSAGAATAAAGGLAAAGRRGGGGARAAFGPSSTSSSGDFALMNPALLTAKRGSMLPGAATPAAAARAPRMTMALAAYKKPLALQTRRKDYEEAEADEEPSAYEHEATGLIDDEEAGAGHASGGDWNNGGYGEDGADGGAAGNYDYSSYEGYDEHGNYVGDGSGGYDYSNGYDAPTDAPAEDYQDEDMPLEDDPDADDYMDDDEAIVGIAGKKAAGKKVTGGGYLKNKAKKAAPAAAMPPLPEPKKLVIGKGALVQEKVETQVIKLRRVSKIKGDSAITEMRKQSAKISRPSAAFTSGFGPTAAGSSRNLLDSSSAGLSAGGAYTFAATVARFKVKAETARSAVAAKRGSAAAPVPVAEEHAAEGGAAATAAEGDYYGAEYGYGEGYDASYAADGTYADGTYADGTYADGTYADGTYADGTYAEGGDYGYDGYGEGQATYADAEHGAEGSQ